MVGFLKVFRNPYVNAVVLTHKEQVLGEALDHYKGALRGLLRPIPLLQPPLLSDCMAYHELRRFTLSHALQIFAGPNEQKQLTYVA